MQVHCFHLLLFFSPFACDVSLFLRVGVLSRLQVPPKAESPLLVIFHHLHTNRAPPLPVGWLRLCSPATCTVCADVARSRPPLLVWRARISASSGSCCIAHPSTATLLSCSCRCSRPIGLGDHQGSGNTSFTIWPLGIAVRNIGSLLQRCRGQWCRWRESHCTAAQRGSGDQTSPCYCRSHTPQSSQTRSWG